MRGGTLIFRTVNAAVTGTFKALKAVRLSTKNAPIEVDIELVQTADALHSTIADLVTANGYADPFLYECRIVLNMIPTVAL